eukprot:Polyplicarium_translucidae@DN3083_c0_g1_i2.p1
MLVQHAAGRLRELADDEWMKSIEEDFHRMCPLSQQVWWRLLEMGKGASMRDQMDLEYRLAQSFTDIDKNFGEGITALLLEKRPPSWIPASIGELTGKDADRVFDFALTHAEALREPDL